MRPQEKLPGAAIRFFRLLRFSFNSSSLECSNLSTASLQSARQSLCKGFQFGCGSACTKHSGKSLCSPRPTPSFLPAATARSREEHVIVTDKSAAGRPEASIMTSLSPSYKPVAGKSLVLFTGPRMGPSLGFGSASSVFFSSPT